MTITKRIAGLAAATITATMIAASAASAGIGAPKLDVVPGVEVQQVRHTIRHRRIRHRRCFGFRRVLPRRVVYLRLLRQGFVRIRGLRYRPARFAGGRRGLRRGIYVATASRRSSHRRLRYFLRINACTGRVISVRGPFHASR